MVLKTELCRFSGAKIYPGKGIRFVRGDSQVFLFASSKCKRYFHNRLKPAKLTWTAVYRKQHKKDIHDETATVLPPYTRKLTEVDRWCTLKSSGKEDQRSLRFGMQPEKQPCGSSLSQLQAF
ncbi:hypothetical protein HPP92_017898 [Vanilla planifolia]|uniref:TRASH domain-containing protein n=1 Tax=Vanilla planifolia TaxID=51239 RepID=A0A835Q7T2_VANPL|nr:hypothetical protein HPP92_017898 [Vanilla planifolia]